MKAGRKKKQISKEDYIKAYCQEKRIRGRFAVYISPETHDNLKRIVNLFKWKHYTTTSSLADSIISDHIEVHKELLNSLHKEEKIRFKVDFDEDIRRNREKMRKLLGDDYVDDAESESSQHNDSDQ